MNLTQYHRDAFVRAAIHDVPQVDYPTQVNDLGQKLAIAALPPAVRRCYENLETREYIRTANVSVRVQDSNGNTRYHHMYVPRTDDSKVAEAAVNTPEMHALVKAGFEQAIKLHALAEQLKGAAKSVRTRKQLVALLPEFEKYMPAEEEPSNNLPAIANMVAEFVKAGWPKAEAEAKAKAKKTARRNKTLVAA
jgi:hypothetical protein